ncbi:MAG: hypothetical protein JWM63_3571 [Gammaproteobacteria bacterium]|jgi:hypothetical protein|nr:hypothetical protein [Gammaproteobacteria bacterium]
MNSVFHRHSAPMAALLLAGVAASLPAVTRAQPDSPFLLTAYVDAVGGERLVAGQYDTALVQIRSATQTDVSADVVNKTNACVALAELKQLAQARQACDDAVTAASRDRLHSSGVVSKSRLDENESVAIAYTNRAVVHSLAKEAVSSAEDLAEAYSLAPAAEFVARNIAAFRTNRNVAAGLEVVSRRVAD